MRDRSTAGLLITPCPAISCRAAFPPLAQVEIICWGRETGAGIVIAGRDQHSLTRRERLLARSHRLLSCNQLITAIKQPRKTCAPNSNLNTFDSKGVCDAHQS